MEPRAPWGVFVEGDSGLTVTVQKPKRSSIPASRMTSSAKPGDVVAEAEVEVMNNTTGKYSTAWFNFGPIASKPATAYETGPSDGGNPQASLTPGGRATWKLHVVLPEDALGSLEISTSPRSYDPAMRGTVSPGGPTFTSTP